MATWIYNTTTKFSNVFAGNNHRSFNTAQQFVGLYTKMIHINSDKLLHDKPSNDKTALFPLHPLRALFVSMPGGGKRQACLELIGRHPKPFGTITVMHLDPKETTEYEILGDGAKMIGEDELPDALFTWAISPVVFPRHEGHAQLKQAHPELHTFTNLLTHFTHTCF